MLRLAKERSEPFVPLYLLGASYLGVLSQIVQCSDVEGKLARLCKLAETDTEGSELLSTDADSHSHHAFTTIQSLLVLLPPPLLCPFMVT